MEATPSHLNVYEYINTLVALLPKPDGFAQCNFAILCDKFPFNLKNSLYLARVLYVSLQNGSETIRFYPNKLKEMDLEFVKLSSNSRRKLSANMREFFVNGNTEKREYKGCPYYNHSIERTNINTKDLIARLREKYNIAEPDIFIGKHQDLVLDDDPDMV